MKGQSDKNEKSVLSDDEAKHDSEMKLKQYKIKSEFFFRCSRLNSSNQNRCKGQTYLKIDSHFVKESYNDQRNN